MKEAENTVLTHWWAKFSHDVKLAALMDYCELY